MSSASVSSSKKEKVTSELVLELDSVRALNNNLRSYLEHLQVFKKNLVTMKNNCTQLSNVNRQWVETLNMRK